MTVIVFSGSGILFPAHLGFLQFLYDYLPKADLKNITFVGTSGGSLVASAMATGMLPREMRDLAKEMLPREMISLNWKFWQPAREMGFLKLDKMEKIIRKYLPKTFQDYKQHSLVVVTADLESKKTFYCSKERTPGTDVAKIVRASCSVPFLFTPVEFGKMLLVDGGITNNFAIDYFKDSKNTYGSRIVPDAETIKIKKNIDKKGKQDKEKEYNITKRFDFVLSVFECMMGESLKEHTEDATYAKVVNVNVPYEPFNFSIKAEDIDIMFSAGYEDARRTFVKEDK